MLPEMYEHTVAVKRGAPLVDIYSSVACLVEPTSAMKRPSLIGVIANARYVMTWGTEDILNGDTIVFNGRNYIIAEIVDDTLRPDTPYRTGTLTGAHR